MTARIGVWAPPPRHAGAPVEPLPFPLASPDCHLFSRARHGLWAGAGSLGLRPGDGVLVPAYHHGSEIEALARAGLRCGFYEGALDLAPDEAELDRLLTTDVRALLLIHYVGFPQDAPRWRAWCDRQGLLLLEDAAQAWLASIDGRPVGSWGDLALFCLYKVVGVPDGAALVCRGARGTGSLSDGRGHVAPLAQGVARLRTRLERPGPYLALRDFALGDPTEPPSSAARGLVGRLGRPDVPERRRANYRRLLDELGDLVPPPFDRLPDGASPMVFPVDAPGDDKAALFEQLGRAGIDALDFWSVPHPSLPVAQFPAAAARRRATVGLPMHQALGPDALDRIARAVRA